MALYKLLLSIDKNVFEKTIQQTSCHLLCYQIRRHTLDHLNGIDATPSTTCMALNSLLYMRYHEQIFNAVHINNNNNNNIGSLDNILCHRHKASKGMKCALLGGTMPTCA